MYLTGFADEAGDDIRTQIKATQQLGWQWIESRGVNGTNLHDISDEDFEDVCAALDGSGVGINCFGSAIANWGKKIDEPFDSSLEETRRAIPRMQRLGTKLVRVMSFAVLKDRDPEDQMFDERARRLRELVAMFSDAGITAVHENCMNYGGMGPSYTLRLLDAVPGLKLVFDTGNPVFTCDYAKNDPKAIQSAWEFYAQVKDHVAYVHIKDGTYNVDTDEKSFTWPGDGDGDVKRIVKDLLDNGYDGGFSMEPHMKVVYHEEDNQDAKAETRIANYIEYGRRFMTLLEEVGHPVTANA